MDEKYLYIACFLDDESVRELESRRLGAQLQDHEGKIHMTIKYNPGPVDEKLFGKGIKLRVIGYGNNSENEGYLVEAYSDDPEIQKMINNIEIPHITMSISENSRHHYTRELHFEPVEPFEITGKLGGCINTGTEREYVID